MPGKRSKAKRGKAVEDDAETIFNSNFALVEGKLAAISGETDANKVNAAATMLAQMVREYSGCASLVLELEGVSRASAALRRHGAANNAAMGLVALLAELARQGEPVVSFVAVDDSISAIVSVMARVSSSCPTPGRASAAVDESSDGDVACSAALAFAYMTALESAVPQIIAGGAIEALLSGLRAHSSDEVLVRASVDALRRLVDHRSGASRIAAAGGAELLVGAIRGHGTEGTIVAAASGVIAIAVSSAPARVPPVVSCGGAEVLVGALQRHVAVSVVAAELAIALCNLTEDVDAAVPRIVAARGAEALVAGMRRHEAYLPFASAASRALTNLARTQCAAVVCAGAAAALVSALRAHPTSLQAVTIASLGLEQISHDQAGAAAALAAGAVDALRAVNRGSFLDGRLGVDLSRATAGALRLLERVAAAASASSTPTASGGGGSGGLSCAVCGAVGNKKCARCKAVVYCGPACQRQHWAVGGHKAACVPMAAAATEVAAPEPPRASSGTVAVHFDPPPREDGAAVAATAVQHPNAPEVTDDSLLPPHPPMLSMLQLPSSEAAPPKTHSVPSNAPEEAATEP